MEQSGPRISVIVTTYNKERELELVLEAFRHQSFKDFEIIVADDGSGEATRAVIDQARERADHPVLHSWQEDQGFRAARSRNLAIAKARGELVAMVDGDCLPLPNYLDTILETSKHKHYLAGERFFLTEDEAAALKLEDIAKGGEEILKAVPPREQKRVRKVRRKNRFYRTLRLKVRPKVVTANFVAYRRDLERINGFDERYVGWGHEDTDLGRRLRKVGVPSANALSEALVIHIWHKTESSFAGRVRDCDNADYFNRPFLLSCCREGLLRRSYDDLRIDCQVPELANMAEIKEVFQRNRESFDGLGVEVSVCVVAQGKAPRAFIKNAEVNVLVIERGSQAPSGLLKAAHIVLSQNEEPRRAVIFEALEGDQLESASLETARNALDRIL